MTPPVTIEVPRSGDGAADMIVRDASGDVLYVIEAKTYNAGSRTALERIARARARLDDVDRHLAASRRAVNRARERPGHEH